MNFALTEILIPEDPPKLKISNIPKKSSFFDFLSENIESTKTKIKDVRKTQGTEYNNSTKSKNNNKTKSKNNG